MFYSARSLNCHLTRQRRGRLSGYGDKRNCPFGFQPVATEPDGEISSHGERESKSESERKQCKTLTTNKKIKKEMQIREKLKILSVCQSVLVKVFDLRYTRLI